MNDHDPHDPLWALLGKAKQPQVSPFFARNVLRQIRETEEGRLPVFAMLWRRWRLAAVTAAILLTGTLAFWRYETGGSGASVAQEVAASPDYEVIVQLDDLLAYEENTLWLESSDQLSTF